VTRNGNDDPTIEDGDQFGEDGEMLSVWDAADICLSRSMDENYTIGCDENEQRRAADLD